MNTRNYLSTRYRHHTTQAEHDRAFLRTLVVLIVICIGCAIWARAEAQDAPKPNAPSPAPAASAPAPAPAPVPVPSPYKPNELQSLQLENAQLRAINANQAYQAAQAAIPTTKANFESSVNALVALCNKIKTDNKWPATVRCDINQNPIVFQDEKPVTPSKR